jgi:cytochrome d ubiquinol oxidase subunit II
MHYELLLAVVLVGSLTFYTLLGGADYGGGIWDLLSTGSRAQQQRDLIANAITPVWEVNHVWLILVIVLLFAGFPPAFAAITTALHIPLVLLLLGIVFRGMSFTFRTYDTRSARVQRFWGYIFSVASLLTPMLLGVVVGAVTDDNLRIEDGNSVHGFVHTWLSPFPIIVGLFAVSLFAYLAATFLTVEAHTEELREDFRTRALFAGCTVAFLALVTFLDARYAAREVEFALLHRSWSVGAQLVTAAASIASFWCLVTRRYKLARIAVGTQISCILWGWALAQFPFLVRPQLTIYNSASPDTVLRDILLACVAGTLVLFPSMRFLYKVFKAEAGAGEANLH